MIIKWEYLHGYMNQSVLFNNSSLKYFGTGNCYRESELWEHDSLIACELRG